jgi:hypothetical protein
MNYAKKTRKMQRLAFLIILFSLLLGAQATWGSLYGGNEVQNGDFQTGNLLHWTSSGDQIGVTDNYTPGDYYARLGANQTCYIYQVIDESQYSGWNQLGTGKLWSFNATHDQFQADSSVRFDLYYYPSNPTGQPAFDPTNPTGWTNFLDHTFYTDEYGLYQAQGTINNFQPQWVAVVIQMATGTNENAHTVADNVDFEGKCVPLPGAALLLGSGLVGLAGWRLRRR